MDLLVDSTATINGQDSATFSVAILISLITTIYSNCKALPGLAVMGELLPSGVPVPLVLDYGDGNKYLKPLLDSRHHGMKKLLVPSFMKDRILTKLEVLKEEEEKGQVFDGRVGVEVVGYRDLKELLEKSLMVAHEDVLVDGVADADSSDTADIPN